LGRAGSGGPRRRTWDRRPNPARREELLAAVSTFLLEKGLGEFSLRRAADAAGTSAQLLVHYFGTRERLVSEALTGISVTWLGNVFDRDMGVGAFDELFWQNWHSFTTEEYLQHLRLMYEVLSAAFRQPGKFQAVLDSITVRWQTRFEESLTAIAVPPATSRRISTMYIAVLRGLLLDFLATGDKARIDDAAGLVLENLKRDVLSAMPSNPA
jgi:AcrR family transcriptional regulator